MYVNNSDMRAQGSNQPSAAGEVQTQKPEGLDSNP